MELTPLYHQATLHSWKSTYFHLLAIQNQHSQPLSQHVINSPSIHQNRVRHPF
eukprot:CCRYP_012201-RA/>CCRYP_012201-RA protein AED:0.34 eAED:0.34 QI:29/1/1/1/0/0/2/195/52